MSPATLSSSERLVLELIAAHDGEWGWYQLDRGLTFEGVVNVHVPTTIEELARLGLVIVEGDPTLASSRFRITQAGREYLSRTQ